MWDTINEVVKLRLKRQTPFDMKMDRCRGDSVFYGR